MTNLKVGDKVRFLRSVGYASPGDGGVVIELDYGGFDARVRYDKPERDGRDRVAVHDNEVEVIPAYPKVGDKVRVTFESEVVSVGLSTVTIQDPMHGRKVFFHNEAEVIKPGLPTEFGSVVEVDGEKFIFVDGQWTSKAHEASHGYMKTQDYKVIRVGV